MRFRKSLTLHDNRDRGCNKDVCAGEMFGDRRGQGGTTGKVVVNVVFWWNTCSRLLRSLAIYVNEIMYWECDFLEEEWGNTWMRSEKKVNWK